MMNQSSVEELEAEVERLREQLVRETACTTAAIVARNRAEAKRMQTTESSTPVVYYSVTYVEKVIEDRDVWATHETYIDSEEAARTLARASSKTTKYRETRLLRVTQEIVAIYSNGNERGE